MNATPMWKYQISTGELTDPQERFIGTGYSGKLGVWRNNPDAESDAAEGPIPEGLWHIGSSHVSTNTGPMTMNLAPAMASMDVHGRSLFRIHGDNKTHDASHGCIVLGPSIRSQIAASTCHLLNVVR